MWLDDKTELASQSHLSFSCCICGHSCYVQFNLHVPSSGLRYDNLDVRFSLWFLEPPSFGSENKLVVQLKLIKLSWLFLSDMISQYPTLWTEQVRSRQNNRTKASCEFEAQFFPNEGDWVFANLNWKHAVLFSYFVSSRGLRLFLSFKDRWWLVKPVRLGVGVHRALRICLSVVHVGAYL